MSLGCAHHTTTLRKEQFRSTVVLIWSAFSKTWEEIFWKRHVGHNGSGPKSSKYITSELIYQVSTVPD
jgi:hypothetical protein